MIRPLQILQMHEQRIAMQKQLTEQAVQDYRDGYAHGQSHAKLEFSEKIQRLDALLNARLGEIDQLQIDKAALDQRLTRQVMHYKQQLHLRDPHKKPMLEPITLIAHQPVVVANWRESYKWISNWAFAVVMFVTVTPIPDELLLVLPDNVRMYVIAFASLCGLIGRYVNQSK